MKFCFVTVFLLVGLTACSSEGEELGPQTPGSNGDEVTNVPVGSNGDEATNVPVDDSGEAGPCSGDGCLFDDDQSAQSGTRLKYRYLRGEDGSAVLNPAGHMFDTKLETECYATLGETGEYRCYPSGLAVYAQWFADAACEVPAFFENYVAAILCESERSKYFSLAAFEWAAPACGDARLGWGAPKYYKREETLQLSDFSELTEVFSIRTDGSCIAIELGRNTVYRFPSLDDYRVQDEEFMLLSE